MKDQRKILVRQSSALGDIVSSFGLLKLLSQRFGTLDFITSSSSQGIESGETYLKPISAEESKKYSYEFYLDLTSSSATRKEVNSVNAKTKIGRAENFTTQVKMWRKYETILPKRPFDHLVLDNALLMKAFPELWQSWETSYSELEVFYKNQKEKHRSMPALYRLHRSAFSELKCFIETSRWKVFLPSMSFDSQVALPEVLQNLTPKHYAVLHVGAGNPKRILPFDLANYLLEQLLSRNSEVVLVGTEKDLIDPLLMQSRFRNRVHWSPLSIAQLKKVLGQAKEMMGPDSGPLHLASALNIPTTGIFGPNIPLRAGPLQAQSQLMEIDLDCRPCNQNVTCPFDVKCLVDLKEDLKNHQLDERKSEANA